MGDSAICVIASRLVALLAGAATASVLAFGITTVTVAQTAAAGPMECSNAQPYPDSPTDICTGYGQTCAKWQCKYPPGTEGKWDITGHYTPCMGSCNNPYD